MSDIEFPPQQPVPPNIDQALQQAIAHHRAGRLQDAERLYRAILQVRPNHPDANHNLGVLAVQANQPAAGLAHFKSALEDNPSQGQYWISYIDALIQTGQTDAARQVLEQGRQRGLQDEAVKALAGRLEKRANRNQSNADPLPPVKESLPSAMPQNLKKNQQKSPTKSNKADKQEPSRQEINALLALATEVRYTDAITLAHAMTVDFPRHWFGWKVLGAVFGMMGRTADALLPMQNAAALSPNDAEIHNNLGATLQELGQLIDAVASYRRALEIRADYAEAHYNLGNALRDLEQLDNAVASYRRAVEIKPDYAEAHNNLGVTLQGLGQLEDAAANYYKALEIKPDYAEALNNLASLFNIQGKYINALDTIKRSLRIKETVEAKITFVMCVKNLRFTQDDSDIRAYLARGLSEPWAKPWELARVGSEFAMLEPNIGKCVARAVDAWPLRLSAQDLFGHKAVTFTSDRLLCALLNSVPVNDIGLERFLTMARCILLETAVGITDPGSAGGAALNFFSGLARQCFINEYVFSYTAEEIQKASGLKDSLIAALETKVQMPVLWPVAVAAYFPLYSLPLAAQLLDMPWPEAVMDILVQQIREPMEEQQLCSSISRLTGIRDDVSLLVQGQYEENPYPRWVSSAQPSKPLAIDTVLRKLFHSTTFQPLGKPDRIDILIAGCGTGQHPIETARRFRGAHLLAVDLSLASLCYAKRKTRESGLTTVEYAQADLLELGSFERSFDVIESCGVLHHLAEPLVGWRVLLSLLRPGGVMLLGFYSEAARQHIVKARDFIAEQGYGATADEIRQCRQALMATDSSQDFKDVLKSTDFFSTSACRDLLFHVQEHRMTLTGIDAFLRENDLTFLGFEIDANVLHAYKRRFPSDHACTNLAQWQVFEHENPDTFIGMYQFWIQKPV